MMPSSTAPGGHAGVRQIPLSLLHRIPVALRPLWTFAVLVLAQLTFLCSTFSDWRTVGLAMTGLVALVLYRGHTRASESILLRYPTLQTLTITAVILFSIAVMFAARIPRNITETTNFVQIGVDVVAHASLLSTIFVWLLFPRRGHVTLLFLGMLLVLLCVASGGVSRSLPAQTTVGLLACLGFVSAARVIVPSIQRDKARFRQTGNRKTEESDPPQTALPMMNGVRRRQSREAHQKRFRASVVTALGFMMVTGAIANITERMLPGIQTDLQNQLQSSMDVVQQQSVVGGMRYVQGSRLGEIRDYLSNDPEGVALKVFTSNRPGYLRGTVFDSYYGNRWTYISGRALSGVRRDSTFDGREVEASGSGIAPLHDGRKHGLTRFQFYDLAEQPLSVLEIHGDFQRGNKVFLPLSTCWLEMRSAEISVNHHDVIELGANIQHPYVVGVSAREIQDSMPLSRKRAMTRIARKQVEPIEELAREICGGARSSRAKSAALVQYFQSNFAYGLSLPERPQGSDPILYFLQEKHEAHCEYFATATALLLRAVDVPARYVTGYVVDEFDPQRECWLGRNRHAHAWVEAYDHETQTWFAVESTPGRTYFSVDRQAGTAQRAGADESESNASYNGTLGLLGKVWGYILGIRATDFLFTVFKYGQMIVLLGLITWFVRHHRKSGRNPLDPEEHRSQRLLAKTDRQLRRYGLVREPGETLHHFASRVESSADEIDASEKWDPKRIAVWLRDYANARYQGQPPPEVVNG